jgi:hypothetical protein
MFEKTLKEKKNNFERRTQEEVEELQNKVETFMNFFSLSFPVVFCASSLLFSLSFSDHSWCVSDPGVIVMLLLQVAHLNDELQRKETKWAAVVTKLQVSIQ